MTAATAALATAGLGFGRAFSAGFGGREAFGGDGGAAG